MRMPPPRRFNDLLTWIGEPAGGCRYADVLHANDGHGASGPFSPSESAGRLSQVLDASRCQLRM